MAVVAHRLVLIVVSMTLAASCSTLPIDLFVPVAFSTTVKDETLIV